MINYIIINGTNSNTINGLGINELPPISKPPLRVQTEEIDGRDGDISTNLGYGAYDKTISIGLFGTGYDINEVISFFNGEGTVVFSNEPDKYYKYKIINQIDYEALLKFKSATITFHCQPFKYPLEETPLEIEYEYIEQDGVESATMNNTNGGTSLKLDLKGNTSQYTTTGKNICEISNFSSTTQLGITFTNNGDGSISVSGTATGLCVFKFSKPMTFTSGTTYYVNGGYSANISIGFRDGNNAGYGVSSEGATSEGNFTPSSNMSNMYLAIRIPSGTTANVKLYPMLALTSGGEYEPYTNGASPNPDYPQPINVVSGDNEVVVCGKNLLDLSKCTAGYTSFGLTSSIENGGIRIQGTATGSTGAHSWLVFSMPQEYYNELFVEKNASIKGFSNQTITELTPYVSGSSYRVSINMSIVNNQEYDFMVYPFAYIGEEPTTYEPYQSQTYPINLGELELCKIGDYQDYFTKNSDGQWCKYNAIGKVVLIGSGNTELWGNGGTATNYWEYQRSGLIGGNGTMADVKTNYFNQTDNSRVVILGNGGLYLRFPKASGIDISNATLMNNWLSTHNTIVYYVLATPYLSLIEDETLISQLDNIQNAMSYLGQTNVSQVNNDKPFLLDLIAMEKGTDEVVINNIGNVYAKPTIALEGTGETDIYLNNTEILKVDLSEKNKITIDTNNMEAYDPTDNSLANRKVIGNYNSMTLPSGNTTMKITGALTKATITNYSRWL